MFQKKTMSFIEIINHGHKLTNLAKRIFYFPTGDWRVLVSLYKAIFEIGSRISISKILAQWGPEVAVGKQHSSDRNRTRDNKTTPLYSHAKLSSLIPNANKFLNSAVSHSTSSDLRTPCSQLP